MATHLGLGRMDGFQFLERIAFEILSQALLSACRANHYCQRPTHQREFRCYGSDSIGGSGAGALEVNIG